MPSVDEPVCRAAEVAALFDRNAARYDRVNTVICLGQDARLAALGGAGGR